MIQSRDKNKIYISRVLSSEQKKKESEPKKERKEKKKPWQLLSKISNYLARFGDLKGTLWVLLFLSFEAV